MDAYSKRKAMIEAAEMLRMLNVIWMPHIGGDSKDPKVAAKQAAKKRRKIIQDWTRKARGLGKYDAIEGVDALRTSTDVRRWFAGHGIAA